VGMSPVTPAGAYRFLISDAVDERIVTDRMLEAIEGFCRENGISGCSFLFADPAWRRSIEQRGYSGWRHQSYVWENDGMSCFDDYLSRFNANQRRNIRRERRRMAEQGIRIETLTGDAVSADLCRQMYRFYEGTNERYGPWGCKYLTEDFFSGIARSFRHRLLLTAAFRDGADRNPIAMALLLYKGDLLYGRYWGSRMPVKDLHFNLCFYSPIEWGLSNGIRRFDPGIGSFHKVRRGFFSLASHSLHRFFDPRLRRIMQVHIGRINRMEQEQIDALNRQLPFSQGDTPAA
jgi:predicted N-acyltransferase